MKHFLGLHADLRGFKVVATELLDYLSVLYLLDRDHVDPVVSVMIWEMGIVWYIDI